MYKQKDYLHERIGSMRQLAGIRRSVLDDGKARGMRILDINNGSGLSFTVYPDRGMDIGEAWFKGVPLAWLTKNGPVAPQFYEPASFGWLRSWGGGLLTGCGMINVGGPVEVGGENLGLHGRLSNLPAENINTESGWSESGIYLLEITGRIRQSKVFGENLLLTRRISTAMGDNSIIVEDTVTNESFQPSPLMILYHMNLGWPLVDDGCTIETTEHEVIPQNETAAAGITDWNKVTPPEAGFPEQVFYHCIEPDHYGWAEVSLINPKLQLAFKLSYRTEELPYFVQWKKLAKSDYVIGFEPANCFPEGQLKNAERGILQTLAPGESRTMTLKIAVEELN
jgi:galactose mutarotase-like enzyme